MKKKKTILAALVLALVVSIGGVIAYFSDTDSKTNTFTVGKVSIEVNEENWNAENAKAILPNQILDKDPTIKNNGKNEAYVFLKVAVPTANVTVEADDGSDGTTSAQPLFKLINSGNQEGVNDGWTLVSSETKNGAIEYIYAYGSNSEMTKLAKDATTPALFNKVQFANIQEGWGIEEQQYSVEVTGYAIQTENLTSSNAKDPAGVWAVLSANEVHKTTTP